MYWALSLNTGSFSGNIYLNSFLMSLVEIPATFLAHFFMSWPPSGRRWTTGVSLLVASASSFLTIPFIAIGRYNAEYKILAIHLSNIYCILKLKYAFSNIISKYIYSYLLLDYHIYNIALFSILH